MVNMLPRETFANRCLSVWLYGLSWRQLVLKNSRCPGINRIRRVGRWKALQAAARKTVSVESLMRLSGIIECGAGAKKLLRRRAAIALIRLTENTVPSCERLQAAHARGLALALPKLLSTPHQLSELLPSNVCDQLIREANDYAEQNGWGSLHRRYPTVDLPLSCLPSGAHVELILRSHAFPHFSRMYGHHYGPPSSLKFRDLFVAKYDADTPNAQRGLAGHVRHNSQTLLWCRRSCWLGVVQVDASLLSLVLQLSPSASFEGGGTYFEHIPLLIQPGQGGAALFLGKVYHAAEPITRGRRYVLVALVDRRETARTRADCDSAVS